MKSRIGLSLVGMLALTSVALGEGKDMADVVNNPGVTYSHTNSRPTWIDEATMGFPIGTGSHAWMEWTWEFWGHRWYHWGRNGFTSWPARYNVHFPTPLTVDTITAVFQWQGPANIDYRVQNMDAFVVVGGVTSQVGTSEWDWGDPAPLQLTNTITFDAQQNVSGVSIIGYGSPAERADPDKDWFGTIVQLRDVIVLSPAQGTVIAVK